MKSVTWERCRIGLIMCTNWLRNWRQAERSCISAMRLDLAVLASIARLSRGGVVAPSLIPVKASDRVKTDRRDAVMLAKLHRAGELTAVWVPDAAMRDLVRARAAALRVASKARRHLQGFVLRHGRIHPGKKGWTGAYRRWLAMVRFSHPAQQIVLQDCIDAVSDAETRVERLTDQIADLLPAWVASRRLSRRSRRCAASGSLLR